MKKLTKILTLVAILLMSTIAGLFIRHISADLYQQSAFASNFIAIIVFLAIVASSYIPDIWPNGSLFMAITAKAIKRSVDPSNIAGIGRHHYYAFEEDIDTWPAAMSPDFIASTTFGQLVTIPDDDPFVMVTDKFFHPFPCTPETGEVKSTLVGPTDSKAFENVAMFSNAGNNDDLAGAIAYTANKPVVILVKELNGDVKVVGTPTYAALLDTGERTGGVKVADGNLLKHSYKSCSKVPCPTYLGVIPLDSTETA